MKQKTLSKFRPQVTRGKGTVELRPGRERAAVKGRRARENQDDCTSWHIRGSREKKGTEATSRGTTDKKGGRERRRGGRVRLELSGEKTRRNRDALRKMPGT